MKYIVSSFILSLVLFTFTGCDREDSSLYSGPVKASVTIQTRADDEPTVSDNELINSWWVAFVNGDGIVVKIVERNPQKQDPVENESFTVEIDAGIYTIYAFANMSSSDPNALRFGLKEGSKIPKGLEELTWAYVPEKEELIPMTGKTTVDLRQQASTQFKIEVVRLVAKMQLDITNETGNGITLNQVVLQPALSDKIWLFPNYGSLGNRPVMINNEICNELTRNYPESLYIPFEKSYTDIFYLLESTAENHPTNHYVIKMDILHDSGRHEILTAQTDELSWINRNDYIILPLKLVDFTLDFDISFYPPIGGYPAVMLEKKADEFYAVFGSSGKFVMTPIVKASNGYVLAPEEYIIKTPIEVQDPNEILSVKPKIDSKTYEIIGELAHGSNKGTATIKFEVTVKYKGTSTPVSYTFTRTLYIIRQ